jgi:hypothetical protein
MQDVCCTTTRSWQGRRYALPLHPSGCGASGVLNPSQHHRNVSPFHHSQVERSCSSCTSMTKGHFIAPWNPRPELSCPGPRAKGDFGSPLCNPINQPCADWMPPTVPLVRSWPAFRSLDFDQGSSLDVFFFNNRVRKPSRDRRFHNLNFLASLDIKYANLIKR